MNFLGDTKNMFLNLLTNSSLTFKMEVALKFPKLLTPAYSFDEHLSKKAFFQVNI